MLKHVSNSINSSWQFFLAMEVSWSITHGNEVGRGYHSEAMGETPEVGSGSVEFCPYAVEACVFPSLTVPPQSTTLCRTTYIAHGFRGRHMPWHVMQCPICLWFKHQRLWEWPSQGRRSVPQANQPVRARCLGFCIQEMATFTSLSICCTFHSLIIQPLPRNSTIDKCSPLCSQYIFACCAYPVRRLLVQNGFLGGSYHTLDVSSGCDNFDAQVVINTIQDQIRQGHIDGKQSNIFKMFVQGQLQFPGTEHCEIALASLSKYAHMISPGVVGKNVIDLISVHMASVSICISPSNAA